MTSYSVVAEALRGYPDAHFGSGVGAKEVSAAELKVGHVPEDYRDFLQDFGWAQFGSYQISGLGSDVPYRFMDFIFITYEERASGLLPASLCTFYNNGGGDLYCFNVEAEHDESVYCFDHEQRKVSFVAASFSEFLLKLIRRA